MPTISYVEDQRLYPATRAMIDQANNIIAEYVKDGLKLTLRQLYYQFVSRDLLLNSMKSYKKLGNAINDGRLGGLIDWDAIEDRTRSTVSVSHWETPGDIIGSAARSFRIDKWEDQDFRPEVWIEKEALSGVFEPVCRELDVSMLACRGYTSQSEMWSSAMRLVEFARKTGQRAVILHFGDHDPSGIDMSRDIQDRMEMFGAEIQFERLALNMDQVRRLKPPPNPAKSTDSRFREYRKNFGTQSWELDAINPRALRDMIVRAVLSHRDEKKWKAKVQEEKEMRALLQVCSNNWEAGEDDSVADFICAYHAHEIKQLKRNGI